MQGITGIAFIQLSGGTQASPRLRPGPGKKLPVIPSRQSSLETVLEKAPELFEKVVIVADRLSRLVDDRNLKSVSDTLDNIRALTETLATRRQSLARLLEASERTMVSVREVARSVNLLSVDLRGRSAAVSDGMMAPSPTPGRR